jgi:hypothetical protein
MIVMTDTKCVFLDIDGVLNSHSFFNSPENQDGPSGALDPKAVARLNAIIAKTGAKVVVSSSWRYGRSVAELQAILEGRGFVGEVIDKTNDHVDVVHVDEISIHEHALYLAFERGAEIKEWLNRHQEVKSFVVLDDDREAEVAGHADRFIHTNLFLGGLLDRHVEEAVRILEDV